jgi:hypothetical protein
MPFESMQVSGCARVTGPHEGALASGSYPLDVCVLVAL